MSDQNTLVGRIASRFGVDPLKFYETLKATAFKQRDGSAPTHEQMLALLVVAEQYQLNPFTKEIYAFPDKDNGIIPVVGVDGWSRIINTHPQYDGMEFVYSDVKVKMPGSKVDCPEWIDCTIYRKDRSRPTIIREFLDEVYRAPFQGNNNGNRFTINGPWQSHTKRQLRHKSIIQCARIALGFSGIYDQDEAERIRESGETVSAPMLQSDVINGEVMYLEHKELDPILTQLANRALNDNAWSAAHEYIKSRYKGTEFEYAKQFLRDKEIDCMSPPSNTYGATLESETYQSDESLTDSDFEYENDLSDVEQNYHKSLYQVTGKEVEADGENFGY